MPRFINICLTNFSLLGNNFCFSRHSKVHGYFHFNPLLFQTKTNTIINQKNP
jgi:hypothetical protein